MIPQDIAHALTEYIECWRLGGAVRIHSVMDVDYTIDTRTPNLDPVPKKRFYPVFL